MSAFAPIPSARATTETRRSFTLTYDPQPSWSLRRGMDWTLRRYGHGHWCACHGEPSYFSSEDTARAVGELWNIEGRA